MALFDGLKRAFKAGTNEVRAEYAENKDFLEAVCAAVALVANADGSIEDSERRSALRVVGNHATLSKLYKQDDIERCLDTMLKRSKDSSGRQQLARELDDIKGRPDAAKMGEDVYLLAADIAMADGSVSDVEKAVLEKIARRIGVDPTQFEF